MMGPTYQMDNASTFLAPGLKCSPNPSLEPANGFLTQRQTRVVPIEADTAAYPHAAQLISVTREVTHKASGKVEQGRSLLCHKPSPS